MLVDLLGFGKCSAQPAEDRAALTAAAQALLAQVGGLDRDGGGRGGKFSAQPAEDRAALTAAARTLLAQVGGAGGGPPSPPHPLPSLPPTPYLEGSSRPNLPPHPHPYLAPYLVLTPIPYLVLTPPYPPTCRAVAAWAAAVASLLQPVPSLPRARP